MVGFVVRAERAVSGAGALIWDFFGVSIGLLRELESKPLLVLLDGVAGTLLPATGLDFLPATMNG